MRRDLPAGTVTFLFTDVEGSTKLLHELGAEAYAQKLAEHRRVVREACSARGGVEVDTQGDAFFVAFPTPGGALEAARAITEVLAAGPMALRIGLHTGTPLLTEEGYVGEDVHFAARVAASAHGGQVVLSRATEAVLDDRYALLDLGEHRLKDIAEPVAIYQFGEGQFPPLKTISNTNLPRPASSFVGRERERREVLARIEAGARLVTLTGPGGSGKTRLALEAAATLVPEYKAGVFWVGLAPLRDPALVTDTIAQTLGAKDGVAEHIGEREMLLLLDNLEQVIEAAPELASLLQSCPSLTLLVTSRELLRVQGEIEYPVPPLAEPEAVSLFCARAQTASSDEIAELCERLDNLPLAVELAAARTKALSPARILERLSQRLDLLKGGRDADPRQQTLRATIEWSYELLSDNEQELFRRLAVFAGGCTVEAAEAVTGADLDTLQSLVEKSLLRFTNERYWMLETIREYALERLAEAGESEKLGWLWTQFFVDVARAEIPDSGPLRPESAYRLESERVNMRAALELVLSTPRSEDAHLLAIAYAFLCRLRGPIREGRSWLAAVLERDGGVDDSLRQRALRSAAGLAELQRDHRASRALAEENLALARSRRAPEAIADALLLLGVAEGSAKNFEQAEALEREALALFSASGDDPQVRATLGLLAWVSIARGDYAQAEELCEQALRLSREAGDDRGVVLALGNLGHALAKRGAFEEAFRLQCEALGITHEQRDLSAVADTLIELAALALSRGRCDNAAVILGAAGALREETESAFDVVTEQMYEDALDQLRREIGADALASVMTRGRRMSVDEIVAFAEACLD